LGHDAPLSWLLADAILVEVMVLEPASMLAWAV
jgi:hypothetical protein